MTQFTSEELSLTLADFAKRVIHPACRALRERQTAEARAMYEAGMSEFGSRLLAPAEILRLAAPERHTVETLEDAARNRFHASGIREYWDDTSFAFRNAYMLKIVREGLAL